MLTSFQQFFTTCIGKIDDEETPEQAETPQGDEVKTELELATADFSGASFSLQATPKSAGDAESTDEAEAPAIACECAAEDRNDTLPRQEVHPDADVSASSASAPEGAPDADDAQSTEEITPAAHTEPEQEVAETTETDSQKTKSDQMPETDKSPGDTAIGPQVEAAAEPQVPEIEPQLVPLELGILEEIYDFVKMFEQSTVSGAAHVSASGTDCAGGVTKSALFGHPTPADAARIEYALSLPAVDDNEKLFLHFSIGLRDGVVFHDAEHQPGGVKFAIEISGERCFESVSTACRWDEQGIELTRYADKEVVISFLTDCNIEGNSNYAWALWGNPHLLKLTQKPLRKAKKAVEPELRCGIAVAQFANENRRLLEFSEPASTRASQIADTIRTQLDNEIRALSLYASQPKLEIVSVGTTAAVVASGEDFEVQCTVRNTGAAPFCKADTARIVVNGVKLRRGRHTQTIKELDTGAETSVFWMVRRASHPSLVNFSVSLKCQTSVGEERHTTEGRVEVRPALPKLDTKVVKELRTYTQDGNVVMGNKHLCVVFVRNNQVTSETSDEIAATTRDSGLAPTAGGFEYYALFAAKGGTYQQVATCPALSEVTYLDAAQNRQTSRLAPTNYQLAGNNYGESIVIMNGTHTDADGVTWHYKMQWTLSEGATRVKTEHHLETDGKRQLLAFHGPMVYAGQGRNREKKTSALFPGLEFLENDERSSNPRDAAPPLNNRLVPHPYKITVPVMAVEIQKTVVGISWNPLENWQQHRPSQEDADERTQPKEIPQQTLNEAPEKNSKMLSAIFASPNWLQHQKNHLMGVFLPSVPEWVDENQLEASTPYPLTPAHALSIKSELILDGNASILDAVAHWTDAYGTPEPLQPPRNDEEELLLSRHGFMHTTWDENSRKSRHCVDWQPNNEPGFGTLLWYDYLATKEESVKERVEEIAKNTIADSGTGGLAARGSCHILRWDFPFYVGYIDAALAYMEKETQQLIVAQESDGSWRWQPTTQKTTTLGQPGAAVLGTCADAARLLLKHARITRNKTSLEAGLKALAFMKQFSLPRGAQMWECPMYQPDILAAAHAIAAYVEAYELTGEKTHLKQAEYWAKTGVPFLYHWHLPDRPGMQFASIPVFGTTFYTHPWFGVPVQWNGLVFAYYLQHLNKHTANERWHQIAEGITVSAMYQQWQEGELKGTYPDGFYGFCTEGRGPHLNPEDIMVNFYTLRGLDPGIKTVIADGIHLSAGAKVEALTLAGSGQLTWNLSYAESETSYALIAGYGQAPQKIRARSLLAPPSDEAQITEKDSENAGRTDKYVEIEIPAVQTLEEVESGWLYLEDKDAILIKYLHPAVDVQFELSCTNQREKNA